MSSPSREQRADRLRPQLQARTVDRSIRSMAEEIGVSHATISNFLHGTTPSERTLAKIERWLEGGDLGHVREELGSYNASLGDPAGSPAERLIHHLTHPEIVRHFADHPPMDFVKAAFAYALEEDFPQEELAKLARWREAVREASPE